MNFFAGVIGGGDAPSNSAVDDANDGAGGCDSDEKGLLQKALVSRIEASIGELRSFCPRAAAAFPALPSGDGDVGNPFASAVSRPVGEKHSKVVKSIEMLQNWRGRGQPLVRISFRLRLGDNPGSFFDMMDDPEKRKAWDVNLDTMKHKMPVEMEHLGGEARVTHVTTKPSLGGMVSPREFVTAVLRRRNHNDDGIYVSCASSVECEACYPVMSTHVRGSNHIFAIVLQRAKDDQEEGWWNGEIYFQICVNGWVPSGPVIDATISLQCDFVVLASKR